jgi:hypothetical protein
LLGGGALQLDGELARTAAGVTARGNFTLTDATMIRAPRLLQLLAFRSGKNLERNPLIRRLAVGSWALEPDRIDVQGFALEGSGLVDRLKLASARYTFAGEKIAVKGQYFGVGFEVVGTRQSPEVYLQDNTILRPILEENRFDFFNEETATTPAKK